MKFLYLLKQFKKNQENLYVLHDKFSFWEFYKILRKKGYKPDSALNYIFANCSLSALIFEECIWDKKYKEI